MTLKDYLILHDVYTGDGYTKEEALIRKYLTKQARDRNRRAIVDERELDALLEDYYSHPKKKRKEKPVDRYWNNWIPYNTFLLRENAKPSSLPKHTFLNYLYEYDILSLKEALKRGIYNSRGVINVFKDPDFEPSFITKKAFSKMIKSRGLKVSDYFPYKDDNDTERED